MRGPYKKKTKEKIMNAAWELFQEHGYEDTTISEIIEKSGTSRSAFYHHFHGKEELLFTIAYIYDNDYDIWLREDYDENLHVVDNLISFNDYVMHAVESSPFCDFYNSLYGLQVMTDGVRHILNPDRRYYQILRQLLKDGIESGQILSPHTYTVLTDMITSFQIGITYNWCLQQRRYPLVQYGRDLMNPFLLSLRKEPPDDKALPSD
ncbi:TetR/AcrR family transcriptional regulator [Lachnospiraceae bacterium 42-17]|jgi:AcrR family transcriptional regulator|nr:TetR/AcrR family transcriptional regulator [Dorea sp.]